LEEHSQRVGHVLREEREEHGLSVSDALGIAGDSSFVEGVSASIHATKRGRSEG
jgi:hypothetical protein